jgi:hypothetical protein
MTSERGVSVIIVAVCLFALTIFSAIVIDFGVLWVARNQAQNAADAGAMSAAHHLLLQPLDVTGARAAARTLAHANPVWLEPPAAADVLVDVPLPCPPLTGGGTCVRVDVMRGGTDRNGVTHTNALPTFFASMIGIQNQAIMATATAQLAAANSTGCMRPWFLIVKYVDVNSDGHFTSPPDVYNAPGYTAAEIGQTYTFDENLSPSGYGTVRLEGTGISDVVDAIHRCAAGHFEIGQVIDTKPGGGGNPKQSAVNDVIAWDTGAHWDPSTQSIVGSCAPHCYCDGYVCPNGGTASPRVMVVAVCSPTEIDCAAGGPDNGHVTITNLLSFFLESASSHGNEVSIVGRLIGTGGEFSRGAGNSPSAFLLIVRLVR